MDTNTSLDYALDEYFMLGGRLTDEQRTNLQSIMLTMADATNHADLIKHMDAMAREIVQLQIATFRRVFPWRVYPTTINYHDVHEIAFYGVPVGLIYPLVHDTPGNLLIMDVPGVSPRLVAKEGAYLQNVSSLSRSLIDHKDKFINPAHLVWPGPQLPTDTIVSPHKLTLAGNTTVVQHVLGRTLETALTRWCVSNKVKLACSLRSFLKPSQFEDMNRIAASRAVGISYEVSDGVLYEIDRHVQACVGPERTDLFFRDGSPRRVIQL